MERADEAPRRGEQRGTGRTGSKGEYSKDRESRPTECHETTAYHSLFLVERLEMLSLLFTPHCLPQTHGPRQESINTAKCSVDGARSRVSSPAAGVVAARAIRAWATLCHGEEEGER